MCLGYCLLFFLRQFGKVEGSGLVNEVVEPVGVEEVGVGAPSDYGGLGYVVVREIIYGDMRVLARIKITEIFIRQGVGVIFAVTRYEYLLAVFGRHGVNSAFVGGGEYLEPVDRFNVCSVNRGVTALRHGKYVVKAAQKHGVLVVGTVEVYTRKLFG